MGSKEEKLMTSDIRPVVGGHEGAPETVPVTAPKGTKFKISIERKVENIWLEAKELGWSYSDFVTLLLEVLVVINHRNANPNFESNSQKLSKLTRLQ